MNCLQTMKIFIIPNINKTHAQLETLTAMTRHFDVIFWSQLVKLDYLSFQDVITTSC